MSIRFVSSFRAIPEDQPDQDFHLWVASVKGLTDLEDWWHGRGEPRWVAIDARACVQDYALRLALLLHLRLPDFEKVCFVLYTGIPCDNAMAPCGCYGYDSVCEYHRHHHAELVAPCGCSRHFKTMCDYHTDSNCGTTPLKEPCA
jgi:hypothetical protein